jgi:hypothetical protein
MAKNTGNDFRTSKLVESGGNKSWWTTVYGLDDDVPVSGIYRCLGADRKSPASTGSLSSAEPPQHSPQQGSIRWKLNVWTNTEGK